MSEPPKDAMQSEPSSDPNGAQQSRYERLKKAFQFATQRVEPGSEVPEMPQELGDWGRNTSLTMFAGICFLGARQFVRHKRLGPYRPQQPGLSKAREAQLIAQENTRRLLRVTNEAVKGGVQFGSLAGLFYGVQMLSSLANGEKTIGDTVLAGAVAGGVFGGFLPGGLTYKLRSSVIGAALGASAGFPVAFLQMQVDNSIPSAPEDEVDSGSREEPHWAHQSRQRQGDPTEDVIRQLGSGLRKS